MEGGTKEASARGGRSWWDRVAKFGACVGIGLLEHGVEVTDPLPYGEKQVVVGGVVVGVERKALAEGIYLARIHDDSFTMAVPDGFQPRYRTAA